MSNRDDGKVFTTTERALFLLTYNVRPHEFETITGRDIDTDTDAQEAWRNVERVRALYRMGWR